MSNIMADVGIQRLHYRKAHTRYPVWDSNDQWLGNSQVEGPHQSAIFGQNGDALWLLWHQERQQRHNRSTSNVFACHKAAVATAE